jgi:hypothetical protein
MKQTPPQRIDVILLKGVTSQYTYPVCECCLSVVAWVSLHACQILLVFESLTSPPKLLNSPSTPVCCPHLTPKHLSAAPPHPQTPVCCPNLTPNTYLLPQPHPQTHVCCLKPHPQTPVCRRPTLFPKHLPAANTSPQNACLLPPPHPKHLSVACVLLDMSLGICAFFPE